jgi:hypothetical protein
MAAKNLFVKYVDSGNSAGIFQGNTGATQMNQLFLDLAKTKAVLIERGRTKNGDWIADNGCVCTGAAVAIATGWRHPTGDDLRTGGLEDHLATNDRALECLEAIAAQLGIAGLARCSPGVAGYIRALVVHWNDYTAADFAEVLAVVQAAADAASGARP